MNVRTRLALATAMALLALLLTFYIGGRVILLNAFHMVEKEVLRSVPDLIKSLQGEMRQLDGVASMLLDRPPLADGLRLRQAALAEKEIDLAWMLREDVTLVAFADPTGRVFSAVYLPPGSDATRPVGPSLQRHLQPGSPLLNFARLPRSLRSGMVVLDEGPMLVAAQRVPADPAQPAAGVVVVGRDLHGGAVIQRLGASLPGLRLGRNKRRPLELRPVSESHSGEENSPVRSPEAIVSERIEMSPWRVVGMDGYEAHLPVYDIYGRRSVSLVITLPRTFSSLAETAIAWLSLFIALIGILFIAPLLIMQGHAVLNPLTRLASQIEALQFREQGGRRLDWAGSDEFGVVARAVDSMLDAIEHEHRQIEESESRGRALLAANPDLLFLFDRSGCILDVKCPAGSEGILFIAPHEAIGRSLSDVRVLPPDVMGLLMERIRLVFETGQLQSMEFHMVRPDGQDYWGECRIVRIDDSRALAIERNMSDRH
ncbi:MAG: PAS domain-containing protein, partial [bacterium]